MIQPIWRPLPLKTNKVPAKPSAVWTLVHEYVTGPCRLRITAAGKWKYRPGKECDADGVREEGFTQEMLNASAGLGALVGKIGGSPAGKADGTLAFVAGSYVVLAFDDKVEGALYLTMNDEPKLFDQHDLQIEVAIDEAR